MGQQPATLRLITPLPGLIASLGAGLVWFVTVSAALVHAWLCRLRAQAVAGGKVVVAGACALCLLSVAPAQIADHSCVCRYMAQYGIKQICRDGVLTASMPGV